MPKAQDRKCRVFVLGTHMGGDNSLEDGGEGRGERKDIKLIMAFRLSCPSVLSPVRLRTSTGFSLEIPCNLSSDLLEPGSGPCPATRVCIALKSLLAL